MSEMAEMPVIDFFVFTGRQEPITNLAIPSWILNTFLCVAAGLLFLLLAVSLRFFMCSYQRVRWANVLWACLALSVLVMGGGSLANAFHPDVYVSEELEPTLADLARLLARPDSCALSKVSFNYYPNYVPEDDARRRLPINLRYQPYSRPSPVLLEVWEAAGTNETFPQYHLINRREVFVVSCIWVSVPLGVAALISFLAVFFAVCKICQLYI